MEKSVSVRVRGVDDSGALVLYLVPRTCCRPCNVGARSVKNQQSRDIDSVAYKDRIGLRSVDLLGVPTLLVKFTCNYSIEHNPDEAGIHMAMKSTNSKQPTGYLSEVTS
jgi:hypothetical protein